MPRPNSGPRLNLRRQKGAQPIWEIVWYEQGRRRSRSTGTGCREQADKALALFLLQSAANKKGGDPSERRLVELLTLYAQEHAPTTGDPERIGYAVKALLPFWSDKAVADLTKENIKAYRQSRGVKDGTLIREVNALQAAVNYDNEKRLVGKLTLWKPRKPDPRERWLTRSEAAALLNEARKMPRSRDYLTMFILLSLYTGARKTAVLELTWDRVHADQNYIDFNMPDRVRTNKKRGRPPISPPLRTFLRFARKRTVDHVIERNGEPLDDINTSFQNACKRAGLEDVTPHTLRHTVVTWLVQDGVPLWQVSGFVDMSIATIERIYGHHAPDRFGDAVKALS